MYKLKMKHHQVINHTTHPRYTTAFTILEMLLIIAGISILFGIIIIAINPGRQFAQSRNAQRASDLASIRIAVEQYYLENRTWPEGLDADLKEICDENQTIDDGCLDLNLLIPNYLTILPKDPHAETGTGYFIALNTHFNTLVLEAPNSTESFLNMVSFGTTTVPVGGGIVIVDYSCNIPTDETCWSPQAPGNLAWSIEYTQTGAQSDIDGESNTATIVVQTGSYPAAEYCATLDDGVNPVGTWYLPAKNQLWAAYDAGPPSSDLFTSVRYWSSTEYSIDNNNVWFLSIDYEGMYSNVTKSILYSVRCLR